MHEVIEKRIVIHFDVQNTIKAIQRKHFLDMESAVRLQDRNFYRSSQLKYENAANAVYGAIGRLSGQFVSCTTNVYGGGNEDMVAEHIREDGTKALSVAIIYNFQTASYSFNS